MSRSETKTSRKRTKYTSILFKLYGLKPSNEPSEHVMICNAGLSLGINGGDLVATLGTYGKIQSVYVVSKQSHSFVKFQTPQEAQRCFEACNGQVTLPLMKGPVYLLYVESIPDLTASEVFQLPSGCVVLENFVSPDEEQLLFKCIENAFAENGDLKQRKVAHYGYEFIYGKNNIDKDTPLSRGLPEECGFLRSRMGERGYPLPWDPDQLTVNHYLPGQGIPPHVDTHSAFEDPILSLSLLSDCVMEFRRGSDRWSVVLPRRSLLVMGGESRYGWTHGISSRKSDTILSSDGCLINKDRATRVSFTFRRIRKIPCDCSFQLQCDSRLETTTNPLPANLEDEYVHKVYENISDHFSRTRHKPWPAVVDLMKSLQPGSIVLDVGCGNCKYFGLVQGTFEIGSDHSFGLLSISQERGFPAVRSNCLSLPFKGSSVDCVLCIAVIHHLSSDERRIHSIREILRVLSPTGVALIYVWAKDQMYKGKASNYLKHNISASSNSEHLEKSSDVELPVHVNRTDFDEGKNDVFVPWKLKQESSNETTSTFLRYYHVFDEGELDDLCLKAGAHINKSYYDNGNWCCLIGRKHT